MENKGLFGIIVKTIQNTQHLPYYVREEATKLIETTGKPSIDDAITTVAYQHPEVNSQADVADRVLDVITPMMIKHGILQSKGRNVHRDVYVAVGGKNEVKYE